MCSPFGTYARLAGTCTWDVNRDETPFANRQNLDQLIYDLQHHPHPVIFLNTLYGKNRSTNREEIIIFY